MNGDLTQWVAGRLAESQNLEVVNRSPEGYLVVRSKTDYTFVVAVLSVPSDRVIEPADVDPLFSRGTMPQLVVNVPSKTLWSGVAIHRIHTASAAFGTLGDVARAAATGDAGSYRDRGMGFFIRAMKQHSNVTGLSYIYDSVIKVERKRGGSIAVAVIDAYNMSAEDVRYARERIGRFDVIVKSSNYGSITAQAQAAAIDMGAQALSFRDLMKRLGS